MKLNYFRGDEIFVGIDVWETSEHLFDGEYRYKIESGYGIASMLGLNN